MATVRMRVCNTNLILRMSSTYEQQLQGAQVTHTMSWTPDYNFQKCLTQLGENAAVIQHPERVCAKHGTYILHTTQANFNM